MSSTLFYYLIVAMPTIVLVFWLVKPTKKKLPLSASAPFIQQDDDEEKLPILIATITSDTVLEVILIIRDRWGKYIHKSSYRTKHDQILTITKAINEKGKNIELYLSYYAEGFPPLSYATVKALISIDGDIKANRNWMRLSKNESEVLVVSVLNTNL